MVRFTPKSSALLRGMLFNYFKIALINVIKLQVITTIPTAINIFLVGNLVVNIADKGAVMTPPMSKPAIIFH